MITPHQLRSTSAILEEESQNLTSSYTRYNLGEHLKPFVSIKEFYLLALTGKPVTISQTLRMSKAGTLEHTEVHKSKAFEERLIKRAMVAVIVRLVRAGLPISARTKDWLATCLHAQDFKEIAIAILKS